MYQKSSSSHEYIPCIRFTPRTRISLFIAVPHDAFQHDEQALQSRLLFPPSLFLSTHVREMSIKRRPHNLGVRLRGLSVPREPYEAISRNKLLPQLRTLVTSWNLFGDTCMFMTKERWDKNVLNPPLKSWRAFEIRCVRQQTSHDYSNNK